MTTHPTIAIHWFRQDLRLSDNPALSQAAQHGRVLPIYILDDDNAGDYVIAGAKRWWLHHSLTALKKSLAGDLLIFKGNPQDILNALIKQHGVNAVYWNRCYEPWRIQRDSKIKAHLKANNIQVITCNSQLLWEPWQIKKGDGTPYKVFTPFYRRGCLNAESPRQPLPAPTIDHDLSVPTVHMSAMKQSDSGIETNKVDRDRHSINPSDFQPCTIEDLQLLPTIPWYKSLTPHWQVGEIGAHKRLQAFIKEGLGNYKEGRNTPAKPYVSRLSPHLHFGEISPHQIWHTLLNIGDDQNIDHYCSELGWREFSYSLLYQHPDLPRKNLQARFDHFPWANNKTLLQAWQKGQTGVPMVDAGMRELWQTGFMHNRVRMIVGSFLVKNLRLHWHHGERWFWDTLVDADLANNSASWQWIAGCGADAAPYFRIFNPVIQGQKFDPDGSYVRQYVPEIAKLPNKYLFNPWEAPALTLQAAGIKLGNTYPEPIIDLKQSREAALLAFQSIK